MNRDDLLTRIRETLDYWSQAVDWDKGGIHYIRDDFDGGAIKQDRKCLLIHVRQLYNYSVGADKGIENARKVADHLSNSLDEIFPKRNDLYQSVNFSEHEEEEAILSAYDLYFVVIGLAKYAAVSHNSEKYYSAKQLFYQINAVFDDGDFASKGCFTNFDARNGNRFLKSGNTMLHRLEACDNLIFAAQKIFDGPDLEKQKDEIKDEILKIYSLFENKIYQSDLSATLEGFDDEMNITREQRYGYITNAHPIEWYGFWLEAIWALQLDLPFFTSEAKKMVDTAMARSYTDVGCFGNNFYLKEQKTIYSASFWAQSEAILAYKYAAKHYADSQYADWAEKMYEFYNKYFLDREFGGIFSDVTKDGVVASRSKGYAMKCDYHNVRMCEKILDWQL